MELLVRVVSFLAAIAVLIAVHEFGHYWVARRCGVKVLRFSLGFGRPIYAKRLGSDGTEWAVGAFPLGGYVKMLDEREGPVDQQELPRAFNRQSVSKRFAIVAAGPIANFLFAIVLYWGLYMVGTEEFRPILGAPPLHSTAADAGIKGGETVLDVDGTRIESWTDFRWLFTQRAVEGGLATLRVQGEEGQVRQLELRLSNRIGADDEVDFMGQMGFQLQRPRLPPVLGALVEGGAAAQAGLQPGDRVLTIDEQPVDTWDALVSVVKASPGKALHLEVERGDVRRNVVVVPDLVTGNTVSIGRIGAMAAQQPDLRDAMVTTVRYAPLAAISKAIGQTWETSVFSLKMFGRMILGQISWKNLSGPVTIADYAGQSAKLGVSPFLKFLALISISLGVLNLLPVPLLDGGHLMYYLIEGVQGKPVSERVMEIGQQVGLAVLLMLMGFAFYNDINRLFLG